MNRTTPTMQSTRTQSSISHRRRRIGRKALKAYYMVGLLNPPKKNQPKFSWRMLVLRPKLTAVIVVGFVAISGLVFGGLHFYAEKSAVAQQAAATELQSDLKAKSIAADACRRKKVEQKADQLGKVTYDELYDYGECDK